MNFTFFFNDFFKKIYDIQNLAKCFKKLVMCVCVCVERINPQILPKKQIIIICGDENHCKSPAVGFFSWRDFANFPQIYWENFGKYIFSIVNSTSFAKFFC
jgi:hypothetical protein